MKVFVIIIGMFFLLSCATLTPEQQILKGMEDYLGLDLEEPEKYKDEEATLKGWVPQTDSGYVWEYWAPQGNATIVVARCEYSYMKLQGIRQWTGRYYNQATSLWGDDMRNRPHYQSGLEELAGCVKWVEHFMYGDYYI
jgi:hypothetical protein